MKEHFDNRWTNSVPLEKVNCLICGNAKSFPIHLENGFRVVRCTSCAFVYVNPRPRQEDLRFSRDRARNSSIVSDEARAATDANEYAL